MSVRRLEMSKYRNIGISKKLAAARKKLQKKLDWNYSMDTLS